MNLALALSHVPLQEWPVTRNIGFIGYDGVNALDLVGPAQVFAEATMAASGTGPPAYRIHILGPDATPFTSDGGMTFAPAAAWADAPPLDTLIIPGGGPVRGAELQARLSAWLHRRQAGLRRIAAVCTGFYGLAASGLLDGRRATTHWRFFDDARRRFPAVSIEGDCIFVRDGRFITSGGVCAGIDLAFALVAEDMGPSFAHGIAREMVAPAIRVGAHPQYSSLMRAQARAPRRLGDLVAWIASHLDADLTIPALAQQAAISERQLARLFRDELGETPATCVERLRLAAAREALAGGAILDDVARMVGYRSTDAFRRAFARVHGTPPGQVRPAKAGIVG